MTAAPELSARRTRLPADIPWWAMDTRDVAFRLGTDPRRGLSVDEAARRLAAVGPNKLRAARTRPAWLMFLSQFANTMIVVLLGAAVVTAIVGDLKDTVVIGRWGCSMRSSASSRSTGRSRRSQPPSKPASSPS